MEKAGFTLFNPGSGEGLAAAIAKAYERKQPIFAYYWAPTSVLGKYPMVKLGGMKHDSESWACMIKKDCDAPVPNQYPRSVAYTVVTSDFAKNAPEAYGFISKFKWRNSLVNKLLAWKDDQQATGNETAKYFLKNHEDVWSKWVTADVAAKVKDGL